MKINNLLIYSFNYFYEIEEVDFEKIQKNEKNLM